jgi:hypothetical protein
VRLAGYVAAVGAIAMLTSALSARTEDTAPPTSARRLVDLAVISDSVRQRPRVVVLELDRGELSEIVRNPGRRGRHWERVGRVAFLTDGQVTFESPVGVRVHGGSSRFLPQKSLRLYFRPSLQASHPRSADVGLEGDMEYESLILHGDVRPDTGSLAYHYANPISYAVARRLGIMTAATVPASLVINGRSPLPYVTSEHINPRLVARLVGHDSITVYNLRDDVEKERVRSEGPIAELTARFGAVDGWTMDQVGEVVDLDNLINWWISVMYCGTRDIAQGTLILDHTKSRARWSWMAWDYDISFGRLDNPAVARGEDFYLQWLEGRARAPDPDARAVLLRRLFTSSEPFRRRFAERFVVARDSLLTQAFLDRTLAEYEQAAVVHGITDLRYQQKTRDFLMQRSAVLTEQLRTRLSLDLP